MKLFFRSFCLRVVICFSCAIDKFWCLPVNTSKFVQYAFLLNYFKILHEIFYNMWNFLTKFSHIKNVHEDNSWKIPRVLQKLQCLAKAQLLNDSLFIWNNIIQFLFNKLPKIRCSKNEQIFRITQNKINWIWSLGM